MRNALTYFVTALIFFNALVFVWSDCGGRDSGKEIVEVLIWSGGSWAGFTAGDIFSAPNYLGHDVDKRKWNCPVDCRYTTDKSRIGNVDGVIFEAQPIAGYYDDYKRDPPKFPQKYPFQHWINHGYETHIYFNLYGDPGYMDYIDINMTFTQASQVPITFTCMWGGGEPEDLLKPPPPKSKDKCAVFMATNCASGGATSRTAYTKELMEYMDIDSYGQCLHNKDFPPEMQFPIYSDHGASMRNKIFVFKHYKFVLTFENNNITDYVTEKMMNVLQAGSVPIYMGAPNVHPDWTPGEHSIVQTDHFKGPKDLAQYLKRVCNDDEEYAKFFEWKKKGLSPQFSQRLSDCAFYGAECRLCQYLLEQRKKLTSQQKEELQKRRVAQHSYMAVSFDGQSQYMQVSSSPNLNLGSQFTLSAWVKAKAVEGTILDRGGQYTLALKRVWNRSYPAVCVTGKCFLSSHPIVLNTWYHIEAIYHYDPQGSNSFAKFYVNGVEDVSTEFPDIGLSQTNYASNPALLIGTNDAQTSFFRGELDDISIWNVALSGKQAKDLVWTVMHGQEQGLVAYYSFNQIPDDRVKDETGRMDGILYGGSQWFELPSRPLITVNPCL